MINRMLGKLKGYVRNRARPEGSIVEGYIANEALTFCSMYFRNVETVFSRPERNDDGGEANVKLSVFSQNARPFNGYKFLQLSEGEMEPIYWYILDNCEEIEPFRKYVNVINSIFITLFSYCFDLTFYLFFQ